MKPRQNLVHLTIQEINTGFSALFTLLSGQPLHNKGSRPAAKVFNYLVYQRGKKTITN
ncbi:MAG: hypothetical protein ABI741_13360 [Ferruginibacter sp.]